MTQEKTSRVHLSIEFGTYLLSAIIGVLVGCIAALFLRLLEFNINILWKQLPQTFALTGKEPWFILAICTCGGLLVGLGQKYLGNYPPTLNETIRELNKTGRVEYRHLPQGVVNVLISLSFGGSLGPEAGLTDLVGGLCTWLSDKLSPLFAHLNLTRRDSSAPGNGNPIDNKDDKETATINRAMVHSAVSGGLSFFGSPLFGAMLTIELAMQGALSKVSAYLPNIIGACTGFAGFAWVMGSQLGKSYVFPPQPFELVYMIYAVPLGLVSGVGGLVFLAARKLFDQNLSLLNDKPVARGILGGVGLGVIGGFLPLTLFSGEHELHELLAQSTTLGIGTLLLIGVLKMVATAFCLSCGWKGGIIFPPMFGGAALGLAICLAFPAIPLMVGVTAGMAGSAAAIMHRQPLAVIVLLLGILKGELAGAVITAALVGHVIYRLAARGKFFNSQEADNSPQ